MISKSEGPRFTHAEDVRPTSYATNYPPKRIAVVHVISDLSVGGAEMMLYKLLAETDLNRFAPEVVSLIDRGDLRARIEAVGVPVHMLRMKPGSPSLLEFFRLVRLLRRLKPDLVLGWMYHSCLAAQLASLFMSRRPRVLWSIHYASASLASEKFLTATVIRTCALLSRLADRIIFVSYASQKQHQRFGYYLGQSCVIPNGINTSEFVPSDDARASLRAELGLPADAILIGTTGRSHPTKDHANFLKAAALLAPERPNVNFVMTGYGVDDQNSELSALLKDSGLEGRVWLLGERHDIPRIAAALDVFSLSSFSESFPNVIGEAMACEVPCAVTRVGDSPRIVGDEGIVVPPRDAPALASAWEKLIALGPAGRKAMGRLARARVIDQFQVESVVARYEALCSSFAARATRKKEAARVHLPITELKARFDDSQIS